MKPPVMDGLTFDKPAIEEVRTNLINLRNTSLEVGAMEWALTLSLAVGLLAHLIAELEP